jgi:hypothetical protein
MRIFGNPFIGEVSDAQKTLKLKLDCSVLCSNFNQEDLITCYATLPVYQFPELVAHIHKKRITARMKQNKSKFRSRIVYLHLHGMMQFVISYVGTHVNFLS